MSSESVKSSGLFAFFHIILLALLSLWLFKQNQPLALISPTLDTDKKLQCVSYAPYYGKEQSPFVKGMMISPAQIDEDLQKLAKITQCVRTYSVGQGMDYVPEAAEKIGLKVYLGVWIGWTNKDNEWEVNLAVKKANAFPKTVKALIIGNEVFLRQEQKEPAMQRYLEMARSKTKTPITYADVWEFWKKHPNMEKHVDFVTIHILPYWENDPVNIDHGVKHAINVMANVKQTFSKPILIGETGWPSVGRQRNESKPSLINQARYIREFLEVAHQNNWQYNIIEAIDQPWKRVLEGTVGGYWGVYDTDLMPKFSLTDPVAERNDGLQLIYFALVGLLVFLSLALLQQEKHLISLIGFSALGATAGLTALLQKEYLISACRDLPEWLALGGVALIGWIGLALLPTNLKASKILSRKILGVVLFSLMIASIISSWLIYTDGRYRDFPNLLIALPVLAIPVSLWFANHPIPRAKLMILPITIAIVLSGLALSLESNNQAAWVWAILSVFIALANWPSRQKNPTSSY
jgi:exo-beta-1,3-glucanase (GH17 family)